MYRGPRSYVLLFLFLSVIYHSNLRPVASGDSLPGSLIPFSLLLDGSITLDRFGPYLEAQVAYGPAVVHKAGGHWYSWYPIAGPMLSTPLYIPLAALPAVRRLQPGAVVALARVAEKVTAVTLTSGSVIALFFLLRHLTSERAAWMLTLVFALATGTWSTSSQAMWPHTFGVPAIIGCFYSIERFSSSDAGAKWYWLAGMFAACAVAIRLTNLGLLPGLALALWALKPSLDRYLRVFIPPILATALVFAYNFVVFQNFSGGYDHRLVNPLSGLIGVLASPARGLLIYTPVSIFAVCALAPLARHSLSKHGPLVLAASTFALLHIVFISLWPIWWGGYCWGPRLLTEALPSLMALIAIGLPAIKGGMRYALAVAAVYGILIQALGVYCYPKGHWDHLPVSVDKDPSRLWKWADNPIVRTARGGVVWEPYAILIAAAKGGSPAGAEKLRQLGINSY